MAAPPSESEVLSGGMDARPADDGFTDLLQRFV